MFVKLKIVDELKSNVVRQIAKEVKLPLTDYQKKTINDIQTYLEYSQIEEYEKKFDIRPGMGLAFPQLGHSERIIVVVHEYKEGLFNKYALVNPVITSHSEEIIAAEMGEGCLSVNNDVEGHVPRYARITIEGFDIDGNKIKIRAREELAIAFQHEVDHLNGILFYDRINKDKPFYKENEIRLI